MVKVWIFLYNKYKKKIISEKKYIQTFLYFIQYRRRIFDNKDDYLIFTWYKYNRWFFSISFYHNEFDNNGASNIKINIKYYNIFSNKRILVIKEWNVNFNLRSNA